MTEMSAFQINAKIEELQDKDLDPQVLVDTIISGAHLKANRGTTIK